KKASLSIHGDDISLRVGFNMEIDMDYYIQSMELDGKNSIDEDEDNRAQYFIFKLDEVKSNIPAKMTYVVPDMFGPGQDFVHENVAFSIQLTDLDTLPEKEKPEVAPEEREVGNLLTEKEADAVYKLEYVTDSDSTRSQL